MRVLSKVRLKSFCTITTSANVDQRYTPWSFTLLLVLHMIAPTYKHFSRRPELYMALVGRLELQLYHQLCAWFTSANIMNTFVYGCAISIEVPGHYRRLDACLLRVWRHCELMEVPFQFQNVRSRLVVQFLLRHFTTVLFQAKKLLSSWIQTWKWTLFVRSFTGLHVLTTVILRFVQATKILAYDPDNSLVVNIHKIAFERMCEAHVRNHLSQDTFHEHAGTQVNSTDMHA